MVVIKGGILKVRFGLYIIIIEGLIVVVIKFIKVVRSIFCEVDCFFCEGVL